MKIATETRELSNGDKIKLSLQLDIDRTLTEFDELETISKVIKDMYINATKALFQDDSESVVKKMIGMQD